MLNTGVSMKSILPPLFLVALFRVHASPASQVTPAPSAPWADCVVGSAAPCHGIVYEPPTWCQAQSTNILYYTISGATGTGACAFTAQPTTTIESLGIRSTYDAPAQSSCLTYLGLTAVVTQPTTIAAAKVSTPSVTSAASNTISAVSNTNSAVATITPKQKDQLATYLKNAKIAGAFGFSGVLMFTTLLSLWLIEVGIIDIALPGGAAGLVELAVGGAVSTFVFQAVWSTFLGVMTTALLVALAMVPFFIYEIIMAEITEFRNNNEQNWPKSMPAYNKDAGGADAAWAIRVFSDEGCGNYPVDYGADPHRVDNGNPVMMAEWASSDTHYSDLQPCQNFMVQKDYQVSSVAVMISPSALDKNDAAIYLFSHPQCSITLDPCGATKSAPNGTFPMTQYLLFHDYMQIYNGSGQVYGQSSFTNGAWRCYKGNFLAFAVVFNNVTNVELDKGYQITPQNTVPAPAKAAVKDYGKGKQGYLTTNIDDTWQDGSKLVPMLFGAGRGRSSDLQGGDGC